MDRPSLFKNPNAEFGIQPRTHSCSAQEVICARGDRQSNPNRSEDEFHGKGASRSCSLRESHLAACHKLDYRNFAARKKRVEKKAGKARAGLAAQGGRFGFLHVDPRLATVKSGENVKVREIGPFRVLSTSRGTLLAILAAHLGEGVVFTCHARDWKLYFTNADDDDLRANSEFVIRQVKGTCGLREDRKYLVAWEGYPTNLIHRGPLTIDEEEKEFGAHRRPTCPCLISVAGVSPLSVDQLVAECVVSHSTLSAVSDFGCFGVDF
jgi:hypothetical protein